ncbi:MAG: hypothetical protein LBB56_08110 [Chitinispirillales bacterium]|jgi:biofilm protein TabA|nr:hypothetical protein [Chitinispirillales bacterium]
MRKYTILKEPIPTNDNDDLIKKIMIYQESAREIYVFIYTTTDEYGSCCADYWFDDLEDAEQYVIEEYGVKPQDWILIDDPLPYCQHDIISPVRIKGRNNGTPIWGEFEIFNGTEWVDF